MKNVLTLGQMLSVHARLYPNRMGARDLERSMTFQQWNERACRLANGLLGLGLKRAIAWRCSLTTPSNGRKSISPPPRRASSRCR